MMAGIYSETVFMPVTIQDRWSTVGFNPYEGCSTDDGKHNFHKEYLIDMLSETFSHFVKVLMKEPKLINQNLTISTDPSSANVFIF